MIATANRLNGIGEYYFSQKLREIDGLNKEGKKIINLGIGSPDLPPHPEVVKILHEESAKANTHAYQSYKGSPILRNAIADWYKTWYGVSLNADTDILPLIGSKEGIMHICMTYLDNGDQALIPNPGYPTYSAAVKLAGGVPVSYELKEENKWQPNFEALEQTDLSKVKLLFVNYPHMPTGTLPEASFFEKLIAFAKKHNLLIVHDNPYSFILNDQPQSLLATPGALDCVLELNSLSKSQNMAGWRVGMLCASKDRIDEVLRFKSNMDSGMFLPLQLAAAKALSLGKDWYDSVNAVYKERREKAFELLDLLHCTYDRAQVGMFVWAKIPAAEESGYTVSDKVLYGANVFITPGGIFGTAGNGYVRVSLCSTIENFNESIARIKSKLS
ncbi:MULTISPECIES: pyridoxal phosphate-dependent aminotransferase [unclassified Paraflavitalea]|uniref:pyridoxal phosphate-dependent aminotransferase n=1 Tax=unclassified Paraflavitalea TaxID=2798305 RepID=UPI003D34A7C9